MQTPILRFLVAAGAAALVMALGASALAQGVTTASVNGFVTNMAGEPVPGAIIVVFHEPSGTRVTTTTRPNGQYNLSGLRVGGPYTVSAERKNFGPQSQKEVYLSLGEGESVNFTLSTDVVAMEPFHVATARDTTFDVGRMSSKSTFNTREVAAVPTVRRDIQDLVNLDSRAGLTENTSQVEFSVSDQGQNSRFNSFLIDGVQANDPFGLNANGFGSLRSPVPLEAIESLSVDLSPYDVMHTGFTGALIEAVTKSGTNEYHGSLYGFYTGKNPFLRAKNPLNGLHDQLQERTQGATISGPVVRNRLFFYFLWEDFKRVTAPPSQTFVPISSIVDQITAAARTYGYVPGTGASDSISKQKTFLGKLDWNLIEGHRAAFTYLRTDSATPNFTDFTGSNYTSLSNHWYQAKRIRDSYNLTVNSLWTPDLRTDAGVQFSKYNGTAQPNGAPFPEVYINGVTGTRLDTGATINGQIDMGTNYSYQLNSLFTKNYNGHLYGEYSLGAHTFRLGADLDKNQYDDRFVQYYSGRYAFASVADFAAGLANYLQYQQAAPGYALQQGYAYYSMADYGLLAEDAWKPSMNLSINGGLRFDYPWFPNRPPFNGNFYEAFGFRNNSTATGNTTLAPRMGVNYLLPRTVLPGILGGRKTQFRGGVGLFQGTNPAVWVANSYQTAGVLNNVLLHSPGNATSSTNSTAAGSIVFNPDSNYVQTLPPPATPTAVINVTDPNFKVPTSWKANLAVDHTLPWWGLVATAEANFIKVKEAIDYQNINLNQVGTLPDGRILYGGNLSPPQLYIHSNFKQVLELTNTDKGGSQAYTVGIRRSRSNRWAFSVSYTHTNATEVQALTSSVATSSFNYRSTINPNAGAEVKSAYLVPNKLVASATRVFHFFGREDAATTVTAVFRLQTGHAYSWVFGSDVNGDGITGNDAFYMPLSPSDARITWASPTQRDQFFAFAQTTDLKKHMGQIVSPNTSYNPEQQTVDLHIEQQIPLPSHDKARLNLFLDCLNFANLFNSRWGAITGLDFGTGYNGYNRNTGVTATYNAATNTYAYAFDPTKTSGQPYFTDLSRWQLQLGARISF
jgi:hypothetical protein